MTIEKASTKKLTKLLEKYEALWEKAYSERNTYNRKLATILKNEVTNELSKRARVESEKILKEDLK